MKPSDINTFFKNWQENKARTIVLVDYANVDKWKDNLGWRVGIRELSNVVKSFSSVKELRRFYYGSDFGKSTKSTKLTKWSEGILKSAQYNNLKIVTKRVKYFNATQEKKCNLDVEMTIDLIKYRKSYDNIVLFTGDGDMAYALKFIKDTYKKKSFCFWC